MPEAESESTLTVVLAFVANLLIAAAKTVAAIVTGSASMVAEAAHSWADAGNEVLLLVANRRSQAPADEHHPLGYGRESYVWSMFAALGLFALGAGVSITHGIQELFHPEPSSEFVVAYIVLGVSFLLEGVSFRQAFRQLRSEAAGMDRTVLQHALLTSDPTTRAVFAEDAAALTGLIIAFVGVLLHQVTGSPIPDAIGSIAVGVLLAVVAIVLVDRNRRFLVGEQASPQLRTAGITTLLKLPEIERVTFMRMEFLGPRRVYLVASVDLVGDFVESKIAETLRALESKIESDTYVVRAVLTLSTKDEASIGP
ncbi:cation diffusion facilitator family transporter [Antrihabitans cavernicola]|uniref:Cation diffusion facilitator family transporter n=1 Tax=Antrihabitans cavernicola TaxID=2495913 RepID=A0A5A7S623_9NOCA|nr:cation diffusion facilitator family transporter [Spelaeibacter cavernicola]KAA0017406.1 cation diffusion facilitator family transporter [Spelaeibacter cavernicola]